MSDHTRLEARVHGRVQGVGFRWFVRSTALRLRIVGWTTNLDDGSVRVVAEGLPAALDDLTRELERGPTGASVERVDAARLPATGEFSTFDIRSGAHRGD